MSAGKAVSKVPKSLRFAMSASCPTLPFKGSLREAVEGHFRLHSLFQQRKVLIVDIGSHLRLLHIGQVKKSQSGPCNITDLEFADSLRIAGMDHQTRAGSPDGQLLQFHTEPFELHICLVTFQTNYCQFRRTALFKRLELFLQLFHFNRSSLVFKPVLFYVRSGDQRGIDLQVQGGLLESTFGDCQGQKQILILRLQLGLFLSDSSPGVFSLLLQNESLGGQIRSIELNQQVTFLDSAPFRRQVRDDKAGSAGDPGHRDGENAFGCQISAEGQRLDKVASFDDELRLRSSQGKSVTQNQ